MISEDKTMATQETLEDARQKVAALAEILFSIGEMLSNGSAISGDTISVLGGIAKDIRNEITKALDSIQ